MSLLAGTIVVACGLFLIGFTIVVFVAPALARRFLMSFASSARTHYAEQAVRLFFGGAVVVRSPAMWQPRMFQVIGWAIVVSSLLLILIPWQWHHRLGERLLPIVIRHMRLYALGSFGFGTLLLYGVFVPDSAGLSSSMKRSFFQTSAHGAVALSELRGSSVTSASPNRSQ